ncbi:YfjD family protein [Bacillaceae bacterium Marseille-Q3522]|nr:YfjD family protein [Bacillaceae bacterium Marseille-Q3522]
MESKNNNQIIQVKAKMLDRIWLFAATGGIFIACAWLFSEGIRFESKYSFFYIFGGLLGIFFGLITIPMAFPAFTRKGKIVLTVTKGEKAKVSSIKKSVYIKDIKDLDMRFHRRSFGGIFFEDILIRTKQNKLVKLRHYNMIGNPQFKELVETHMFPYMTDEAKQNWQKRFYDNKDNYSDMKI